jgi:hypothetical protein
MGVSVFGSGKRLIASLAYKQCRQGFDPQRSGETLAIPRRQVRDESTSGDGILGVFVSVDFFVDNTFDNHVDAT